MVGDLRCSASPPFAGRRCGGILRRPGLACAGILVGLVLSVAILPAGWAQEAPPDDGESVELEALLERLQSDEAEEHEQALLAIVELGGEAVAELEALVSDRSAHPRQRAGAAFALGRIGADSSETVLSVLWGEGYEALGGGLAMQVSVALAEFGRLAPLHQVLDSGSEILAAKAAVQLGLRGDPESLEALRAAWEREEYLRMRPFLAIALGLLGEERGVEHLRAGLRAVELRNHCAVALAALGEAREVRFELEFALEDADPLVRLRALESLIEVAPSNLETLLTAAQGDPDPRVREAAEEASRARRRPGRAR